MRRLTLLLALLAAGCGGGTDRVEHEVTERCSKASDFVLEAVGRGLTLEGDPTLRDGFVVKSGTLKDVWFLAADIAGSPDMKGPDDIAVFAIGDPEASGSEIPALPVNETASRSGSWTIPGLSEPEFSMSDDGAAEAAGCAAPA